MPLLLTYCLFSFVKLTDDEVTDMNGTNRYSQLKQAEVLEQSGRVDGALQVLMQANEWFKAASLLARQQRWLEAGQVLYDSFGGQPASLQHLSQEQQMYARQAAKWMQQGGGVYQAIEIYLGLGDHAEASAIFQGYLSECRCIEPHHPEYRNVCITLAFSATMLNDIPFELDHLLSSFIQTGPQTSQEAECFYQLGHVYCRRQMPENSQELFQRITTFDPHYRDIQEHLETLKAKLRGSASSCQKIMSQNESFREPAVRSQLPVAAQFLELPELPDLPDLPASPSLPIRVTQPARSAQQVQQDRPTLQLRQEQSALPTQQIRRVSQRSQVASEAIRLEQRFPSLHSTVMTPSSHALDSTINGLSSGENAILQGLMPQSAASYASISLDSQAQMQPAHLGIDIWDEPLSAPGTSGKSTLQCAGVKVVNMADLIRSLTPLSANITTPEIHACPPVQRQDIDNTMLDVGSYVPQQTQPEFASISLSDNIQMPQAAFRDEVDFVPGVIIDNRYRIEKELGQGGMAIVYSAFDLKLDELVALKVFDQSLIGGEKLQRFKQELKLARRLSHPNVIRLHDIGEYKNSHYISMELLEGLDLEQLIVWQGPMELSMGLELLIQVCAGLQAAHDIGVIHRDMKPSNIFITTQGVAKIMDFGIAIEQSSERFTTEGILVGSAAYISPERILNPENVAITGDLYSLGIIAYEALTGKLPFDHTNELTLLKMHLTETPVPPRAIKPQIPQVFENIVLSLLAKDPQARFQSCTELLAQLQILQKQLT